MKRAIMKAERGAIGADWRRFRLLVKDESPGIARMIYKKTSNQALAFYASAGMLVFIFTESGVSGWIKSN